MISNSTNCKICSPVKAICSVLEWDSQWVAIVSFVAIVGIFIANASDLMYFFMKVRAIFSSYKSLNPCTLTALTFFAGLFPFVVVNLPVVG
jgi:hypothetical protein